MKTKSLKSLIQNKQKTISRLEGYPSQQSGRDGDFQVRKIKGQGIFLFYKWHNKWYSSRMTTYRPKTAEHKQPVKLPVGVTPSSDGELSIQTDGTVRLKKKGKIRQIISVDKDNLADITSPTYFKRTDTTDMADDEAKDPTFLIENTGHAHLRFYSPSNVYDQFLSFGRKHPETFNTAAWVFGLDSSANKIKLMYRATAGNFATDHGIMSNLTPSSGDTYEQLSIGQAGNIWLGLVQNANSDTDKFLVVDNANNGLVGFRTGAEVLADIGGQASGNYITGTGSLSAGDLTNIGNLSGTNTGDQTLPTNYLRDDASDSTTGTITAAGFTTTGTWTFDDATSGTVGITTVHTGSSFTDNDTSLMTAGAIKEKIEAYGYTTADGDITSVRFVTDSGSGAAAEDTADTANFSLLGSSGVGITNSGTTITAVAVPAEIDHDSLNNFVANEHIDWTGVSAGTIHSTNYSNTMGSGFTVSATTDTNATTITQGDDLMFTAGTGITCETTADGTVTISSTVSSGASALNDLSDVTYSSGDLTITSLDKLVVGSFELDSSDNITLNADSGNIYFYDDTLLLAQINSSGILAKTIVYFDAETANTIGDGATGAIDWTHNQKQKVTITGTGITCNFTNPTGPCNLVLKVIQGDGNDVIGTWDSDIKWVGGSAPTLSTANGAIDILSFYFDGTNYFGVGSLNFS